MRKITLTNLCGSVAVAALMLAVAPAGAQQEPTLFDLVSAEQPPAFAAPTEAVDAFKTALAANDVDGLAKLLGLDAAKLKAAEGTADTFAQLQKGATELVQVSDKGEQQTIELGKKLWQVPFPIVKGADGKWAFDTEAGIEEIINRRIGENETEAVATARAYVEAQEDYLASDRDDDGVLEYAQNLISTPGTMDGLYWADDAGFGESPAGAFADEAQRENVENDRGYFGYRFRVLTGQGDHVLGGEHGYVLNGNMTIGHALVAWPVGYAETGVHTFVVSKEGVVYEADLGPETDALAKAMTAFDPDDTWVVAQN